MQKHPKEFYILLAIPGAIVTGLILIWFSLAPILVITDFADPSNAKQDNDSLSLNIITKSHPYFETWEIKTDRLTYYVNSKEEFNNLSFRTRYLCMVNNSDYLSGCSEIPYAPSDLERLIKNSKKYIISLVNKT